MPGRSLRFRCATCNHVRLKSEATALCPNCGKEIDLQGVANGDYDAYATGESCALLAVVLLVVAPLVLALALHWPWLWAVGAPWAAFAVVGPLYFWLVTRR